MRFVASIDTRFYGVPYVQGQLVDTSEWTRKQQLQFLDKGMISPADVNGTAIGAVKLSALKDVSDIEGDEGQILVRQGGQWVPSTPTFSGGGGDVVDATATVKGKLKLAGDLGGTADAPTVPGLSGKEAAGTAAGLVSAHEAAADPHPSYTTAAELNTAIVAHEAAADPHPVYLTAPEGDNRYAAIGSPGGGGATALSGLSDVDVSASSSDGQVLKWNAAASKWVRGVDAVGGGGGGGTTGLPALTSSGDLYVASGSSVITAANPSPDTTPTVINASSNAAAEILVTGCDVTLTSVGPTVSISIDVKASMNQGGVGKNIIWRLRRTSATGTLLLNSGGKGAELDSYAGDDPGFRWAVTHVDTAPTDGHYVLTIARQGGTVDVYSIKQGFSAATPGPAQVQRLPVSGVAGRVLTEDASSPLGVAWKAPGAQAPPSIKLGVSSIAASSTYADHVAAKLVDGSPTTLWTNNGGNTATLTYDMGSSKVLTSIVLTGPAAGFTNRAPKNIGVQTSADGSTGWSTVAVFGPLTSWTDKQQRTLVLTNPPNSRYFRLDITDNNGDGYLEFNETELYGYAGSSAAALLLLEPGGVVAGGTAVGTIVFEKSSSLSWDFRLGAMPSGWAANAGAGTPTFSAAGVSFAAGSGASVIYSGLTLPDSFTFEVELGSAAASSLVGAQILDNAGNGMNSTWYQGGSPSTNLLARSSGGGYAGQFTEGVGTPGFPSWLRIRKAGQIYYASNSTTDRSSWSAETASITYADGVSVLGAGNILGSTTLVVRRATYTPGGGSGGGGGKAKGWWDGSALQPFA